MDPHLKTGSRLTMSQMKGLLYKRLKHAIRDWKFVVSAFVLPLLLITIVLSITKMSAKMENPPLLLTPSLQGPEANSFLE